MMLLSRDGLAAWCVTAAETNCNSSTPAAFTPWSSPKLGHPGLLLLLAFQVQKEMLGHVCPALRLPWSVTPAAPQRADMSLLPA